MIYVYIYIYISHMYNYMLCMYVCMYVYIYIYIMYMYNYIICIIIDITYITYNILYEYNGLLKEIYITIYRIIFKLDSCVIIVLSSFIVQLYIYNILYEYDNGLLKESLL